MIFCNLVDTSTEDVKSPNIFEFSIIFIIRINLDHKQSTAELVFSSKMSSSNMTSNATSFRHHYCVCCRQNNLSFLRSVDQQMIVFISGPWTNVLPSWKKAFGGARMNFKTV